MNKFLTTATKIVKSTWTSFSVNVAYSIYYLIYGAITKSWWLLVLGVYHFVLSVVRFVALTIKQKEQFIVKFTGVMLLILLLPLVGTVILAAMRDRGTQHHIIVMITIAAYTFTQLTLATINWIKSRKSTSGKIISLRYISFANGFVSIFALQRSMLVSFTGVSPEQTMTPENILLMNILTGAGVCIVVCWLAISLLCNKTVRGSQLATPTATDTATPTEN